jgi:putative membrane protein
MTKQTIRELDAQDGPVTDDPLVSFSPHTPSFLSRLARFPHSGDVMVMGKYDPSTGQVITMDELVGAHGGVGGMQTQPFVLYPSGWTDRPPTIVGADGVHRFLRRYVLDESECDVADATSVPAARAS